MPAYDGSGTLFARGCRFTKLDASGAPLVGANNCYVTDALVTLDVGLTFTANKAVEQLNGKGQVCVSYQAPDTLVSGSIAKMSVCTPDPNIMAFLIGGAVVIGGVGSTNEVQSLAITGTPTGGTFTLTFSGQTTSAIAYNATAATVQAALEALSNIDPGDVTATGGALPAIAVTLTFGGQYAGTDVPAVTVTGSFTGGSSPAAAITTTTPGTGGMAIGYRAPEVNTDATPNGVAIEVWTSAIENNAPATTLPYFQWVFPRTHMQLSSAMTLGAAAAGTPEFGGVCEQNSGFGDGPLNDIVFGTDRVWQYCRVASDPTTSPGFVTVLADA
jgi:hypothetical protein